jgi:hypothetical protein
LRIQLTIPGSVAFRNSLTHWPAALR